MSQLASLISKFDSPASGQSSPHYHHHQPHHSYHHQQSKSSSQHQQSSTTYHQLTSTELTTSGVHTNSSAMSSNTTTPSTIAALTAAATTSSNIHYQHHINAQATHHESTSNHSYNLANSSASKFSNFNHTLTDSSTTGGTTTGTSTKSTNLFSLPVAVNASGVMNGGVYLAASSTTGLVSSGIAGTPMSATTTTTFQISSTDKDNSVSAAICNESGKLTGNNKNSNYHHQKASRNGKYSSSKQTSQHQQQHQTNSDHSLEKSSNTQTQTPQTSNNQTHSNTKFSDQYQSYSPITPIIDYSNNNSDIFSDYSIEAMNSTSVNVNHHHNNVHSHQKQQQQPVTVISSQQQQSVVSRTATTTPPQENSVTYKSIMIIDVMNKQQPSKVATNNHSQMVRRCRDELKLDVVHHRHHNHLSEDDDDDDASVYINEIKFYNDIDHPVIVTNQQKSGGGLKVRNKIERNINNFYLLNNNNSTTTGNSNRNDDAKNKINYVFDEEKIASYDITPLKLRNCMFVASGVDSIDPQAICPGIVDVGHLEHLGRSKKATMANNVGGNSNKKSGQFVLNQKRMRRKLFKENIFHINNRKASLRKPLNYLRQNHIYCRNNEHKRYEFINTTDMDSMISSVSFNDYQFALDCMNTSDSSRSSSPHPNQLKDSVVAASAPSVVVEANLVNSKSTPLCCRQETYHNCKSGSKNNLKSMVNGVKKNSGGKITWLRKSNKNLSNNRAMYNEEISGSQSRLLKTKPKKSRANISNGESSENGSTSNSSTSSESSESSNSSSHSSNGDVIVPGIMNSAVIVMTAAPLTAIPSSEAAAVLMMNKKKQASEGSSDDNEDDEEEMDYNNSKLPGPISIGTDLQVNQQQQNHSCAVDLTPNFYQNGGNFDEADEPASNEYARADDDILAANKDTIVDDKDLYDGCCDGASRVGAVGGISANRDLLNNAASDEEFTYSYGDVLSTAAAAITPASKLADEVKLETAEAIVGTKPTPTIATNNSIVAISATENALVKPSSIVVNYDVLNLNIHRLPGETLGMNLKLGDDGRVVVAHVIENGAAERASDSSGNRCPVKIRDEIVEINGVSLSNVKNEDILSLLDELPLFITLKLKRSIQQDQDQTARMLSPTASPAENINESSSSGRTSPNIINDKVPIGYNLHTIYLSSLESKCIMPNDLKDCSDAEGLYRIQRSTLQIGGEEDHLRKGDVLFNINGEELAYKNKFELVSKLGSLEGIAEVSVLRKISPNCFGSNNPEQQVPYHNGIFAQNSIKLAMRKYEKPSMKSNSEADFATLTAAAVSAAVAAANAATTATSNTSNVDAMIGITGADEDEQIGQPTLERSTTDNRKDPLEILENFKEENQQDQINANSSGGSIMTSFHSDNWLFYDKRPTATAISTLPLPEMSAINDNDEGENQPISRNDIAKITVASNDLEFNNDEQNLELNVLDDDDVKKRSVLPTVVTAPISSIPTSVAQSTAAAAAAPFGVDFDECTARSLTSSSCHSERSVIHLNCVVCFEDDSNLNLAGGNIGAAECSLALAAENDDDDEDNTPTNNDIEPCEIDATIVETNNNEARTPTEAIDASSSLAVSVNVSDKNNNKKQINQIKENLKRESYQTFDGLKEDDGVFELINRHNVSSLLQTTAPTPTALLAHQSSSSSSSMASNKFVSTCQIEIKPAVKNFVSPNLKLIKVNLNTNNTTAENPSLLISSSNITSSKDDDSRTTTNAQMLSAAPKLKATEERETDKNATNRLIDDEETTLNEEYTKSLLTPAPGKTTANNNIDSTSAVLNNENSTSNDETSTLCCKTTAAQPINEISLNAELNQLVEELIESVVENTSSSNNREVKSTDIPSQDEDIDLVVREVVNNLLDQIESRLIENREEDDLISLKNEKSEFDDLKKQMNEDLDNLMREKTCTNLSSPTVKENSHSTNNVNQSIDKLMPSKENNVIEASEAKESSRDEEKADIDGDQMQEEESQMMDRFNTLITARPFNSINLSSTSRQNHHNSHQNRLKGSNNLQAKTLMSMGNSKSRLSPHNFNSQQSSTAIDSSDILLPSVKYSICNRLKNIANQQQQQQKPLVNTIFANANSTTPTSSTTPFSRPENMPHKDAELVIDYVESAFDKQIKQAKSAINNNNSSNNLTASNSFVFSAAANSITNSTNNMALTKPPSQSASQQQSVQKKPPLSSEEPSSASNEHATSVKERIMLFSTNGPNNTPRIIAGLSPKKPKLLNKILNNDLLSTKLVHNQSSPSIGNPNLPFLKKSTTGVAMSSFVSCSQQYCNVSTLRKYSSTTALQVQPQQQQVESTQIVEAIPVKSIDEMVVVETSVKNEEEFAVNQNCENNDFAADNLEQFKSVKERIAYFSSKAAAKRAASKKFLTNLNKAKSNSVLNTSDFGTKTTTASETTRFFPFANKIEIVSSNAAAAINRLNLAKYNCNADDYDSLKHAYKLNALANSTNGVNKSGWKVNNMKSPQAKPFVNGSAIKPTNVNGSSTTSTNNVITHASYSSNTHMKLELKNIIYSNENKITDMIENIETKIKA